MFSAFGPNVTIFSTNYTVMKILLGHKPHYRGVTMVTTSNYYNE